MIMGFQRFFAGYFLSFLRMNKKRLYRRLIILFLALSAVAFAANKWYSSIVVKDIKVFGNRLITSPEITKPIAKAILGRNKDVIDLKNIEEIITTNPYILNARTSFQGRSGVEVNIIERVPVAKITRDGNITAYVDKHCRILPPIAGVDSDKLPTISGIHDDKGKLKLNTMRELVALVTSIHEYGIKKDFSRKTELSKSCGNIVIRDWSGIESVMIGNSCNIKEKLTRLEKCLNGGKSEQMPRKIDLRWNGRIVISI
jgi:hypothetical protein